MLILLGCLNLSVLLLCYGLLRLWRLLFEQTQVLYTLLIQLNALHALVADHAKTQDEQRKLAGKTWVPGTTEQARLEKNLRDSSAQRQWGSGTGLRRFAP